MNKRKHNSCSRYGFLALNIVGPAEICFHSFTHRTALRFEEKLAVEDGVTAIEMAFQFTKDASHDAAAGFSRLAYFRLSFRPITIGTY